MKKDILIFSQLIRAGSEEARMYATLTLLYIIEMLL